LVVGAMTEEDAWTEQQVAAWLRQELSAVPEIAALAAAHHIDGRQLRVLTEADLVGIGVQRGLHRKRVLLAARRLFAAADQLQGYYEMAAAELNASGGPASPPDALAPGTTNRAPPPMRSSTLAWATPPAIGSRARDAAAAGAPGPPPPTPHPRTH
jgi:hypothetical protein